MVRLSRGAAVGAGANFRLGNRRIYRAALPCLPNDDLCPLHTILLTFTTLINLAQLINMSGIAHHLLKRGIDAGRESYRSNSQASDDKPFGNPHAVAATLGITALLWFLAMNAVREPPPVFFHMPAYLSEDPLCLWRRRCNSYHDRNPDCHRLHCRPGPVRRSRCTPTVRRREEVKLHRARALLRQD